MELCPHPCFDSFVAIDFETANESRSSACAVGAVRFSLKTGSETGRFYTLVDPQEPFDPFNISIHGITPEMVEGAPVFSSAIEKVYELCGENALVIAHNAAFDFSVLQYSYNIDNPPIPDLYTSCTYRLATRLIPDLLSYTLPVVAEASGIPEFPHHAADSDAEACGKIFLSMLSRFASLDEMLEAANLNLGRFCNSEYSGIHRINIEHTGGLRPARYNPDLPAYTPGPDSPFFEKTVVFTGALQSMNRASAESIIREIGGSTASDVSKKVDYLVTGYQAPGVLKGHKKSAKVAAAEKLLASGHRIEVIPEEEFLRML